MCLGSVRHRTVTATIVKSIFLLTLQGHFDSTALILQSNPQPQYHPSNAIVAYISLRYRSLSFLPTIVAAAYTSQGHQGVVELLLQYGAEVDAKETWAGRTPLHYACQAGSLKARLTTASSLYQ